MAFNKARGDTSAQFFEELIPSVVDIHASDIPSDTIPGTPPAATTSIVKVWTPAADGRIPMTLDRKYNGNRVWVAKATFESNFSSGSGTLTNILKNFISPKYGNTYVVKVYDGSGVQIAELFGDSSGTINTGSWLFDYKAGILAFESDRSETGNNSTDCIKIEVYQYVGRTLTAKADVVQGGTAGNLVELNAQGNIVDSGYTVAAIADKNYVHEQGSAATVWTVTHNLGKYPSVAVVDSAETVIIGQIEYLSSNQVRLTFSAGFAGKAYFN